MSKIDFHSHILPNIDDGSKSVEESLAMLQEMKRQGIDTVLATPHFYADRNRIDRFLYRRAKAWDKLQNAIEKERLTGLPKIRLAAEVAYFMGISTADEIEKLRIQGTDLLLLEMPYKRWTRAEVEEVQNMVSRNPLTIILAHLERFLAISSNRRYIEDFLVLPIYVQINAESLLHWKTRGKTLKLLQKKGIGLLGSDCHGIEKRTPNLEEGRKVVEKKLGLGFLERMDEMGEKLLEE